MGAVAAQTFNNSGTFAKTSGTGTTIIDVSFNHTGTLSIQSGTVQLINTGAFQGGSWSVTGAGDLEFRSSITIAATGAFGLTGTVKITDGTTSFNSDISIPRLALSYGSMSGSGNVTVPAMTWSGGIMSGTGTTTIPVGGTLAITNGLPWSAPW